MKAVVIENPGGPEVLQVSDVVPRPPGCKEVQVQLAYAGVNYLDVYHRRGDYRMSYPLTAGVEGAGTIIQLGEGVEGFYVGQRVAWPLHQGSYAELANIPVGKLVPIPNGVELELAAAAMMQGITAQYLTHGTYVVNQNDTVLVHAAAGGVGSLLVQVAKLRGARVLATVSSPEKAAFARELGADEVINYREADFETEVSRLTDGEGVTVVYDGVGKSTWQQSLRSLRRRGLLVIYGQASGPIDPVDLRLLKMHGSAYITWPTIADYLATQNELRQRAAQLFGWLKDGKLKVRIAATFPLSEAAQAHDFLESRQSLGKVVLQI